MPRNFVHLGLQQRAMSNAKCMEESGKGEVIFAVIAYSQNSEALLCSPCTDLTYICDYSKSTPLQMIADAQFHVLGERKVNVSNFFKYQSRNVLKFW